MDASVEQLLHVTDVGPIVAKAFAPSLTSLTTVRWWNNCDGAGVQWESMARAGPLSLPLHGLTLV